MLKMNERHRKILVKPIIDWPTVPVGYDYAATDANGSTWAYAKKPHFPKGRPFVWFKSFDDNHVPIMIGCGGPIFDNEDWKCTLQVRP